MPRLNHIKLLSSLLIFLFLGACSGFSMRDLEKKWFSEGEAEALAGIKSRGFEKTLASLGPQLVRRASLEDKKKLMRQAWFLYRYKSDNKKAALTAARAIFLVVDVLEDRDAQFRLSELGEKLTLSAGAGEDPEASYYNALFLGIIVRQKGLMALSRLKDVVSMLEKAKEKPGLDYSGPQRVSGMLYLKAPPWPRGLGDLDKALEDLEAAALRHPRFPQNRMFLAEAMLEDEEKGKARDLLKKAERELKPELWGSDYCRIWKKYITDLEKKLD